MTSVDAAVLLTAIGSGASSSFLAEATQMLAQMPLRFPKRPKPDEGFGKLRQLVGHPFYAKTGKHSFIQGFDTVIQEEIKPEIWFESHDESPEYNSFDRPEHLSLTIIMDLEKTGGAALIETGSWKGPRIYNVYSTWEAKSHISSMWKSNGPESDSPPNLFDAFKADVSGFTGHYFRGQVLSAAVRAINEETVRTRKRRPRAKRVARR